MSEVKEIIFIDVVRIFVDNIRLFVAVVVVVLVATLSYAMLTPPLYTAHAVVMGDGSTSSQLAQFLSQSNIPIQIGGLGGTSSRYPQILSSDEAALFVYEKVNLGEYKEFQRETREDRLKALKDRVKISSDGATGAVTIEVTTPYPELSAAIANAYVEALEKLTARLQASPARRKIQYLEDKLVRVKQDLDSAQKKLQEFQQTHMIWNVDSQVKRIIDEIASLSVEKERLLLSTRTEQNLIGGSAPRALEQSKVVAIDQTISSYQEELKRISGLSLVLADLTREVTVKERVYLYLITQYEQVKLEEMNDTSVVPVLEYARVPEKRSWPKRRVIAMVGVGGGVLIGIFVVFFVDFVRKVRREWEEEGERGGRL